MPEVLLNFLDGEVMPAESELIDFSLPVIQATATELDGNNRDVTVPLTSLKYILLGGEEEFTVADEEELGKVVIHFVDHEIIRAYADRNHRGGPYGIIYSMVDPERQIRREIGIPYTAVKAIFKVRRWDGRKRLDKASSIARILAEREKQARAARAGRTVPKTRKTPLLDRSRPA